MGNLTMDIKQRLQQFIDEKANQPAAFSTAAQLCRDAIGEIERLEKITGEGVSLEMYETLRRERDAARRQCEELDARCRQLVSARTGASNPLYDRIERAERLICACAAGILAHEYSKDLCRNGIEEALKKLANEQSLQGALLALT